VLLATYGMSQITTLIGEIASERIDFGFIPDDVVAHTRCLLLHAFKFLVGKILH